MSTLRFAEGYFKPREMRRFAGSARKRASIHALGSITYLQKYYASGGTLCEEFLKGDMKTSFVDSVSPRSGLMPPSLDILLRNCHEDIQSMLEIWGIISYPSGAHDQPLDSPISVDGNDLSHQLGYAKDISCGSLNAQPQHCYDSLSIDILSLLESSTKAISSIRTYSIHAPVLTSSALAIHRQAALSVIEMLCILEQRSRAHDPEDDSDYPEGYCYAQLNFGDLEEERAEMKRYLAIVQEHLFKPQTDKIETQLRQLLVSDPSSTDPESVAMPKWMNEDAWSSDGDDIISLDRCHDFLEFFRPDSKDSLPEPSIDKHSFLDALSDGYIICMAFNAFVSLTNMPFGFVDKIHENTTRTWRGVENWRFLMQACKFRLEFKVPEGSFMPIEIVKRTDLGREQLETWVKLIVQRGIQEAKDTLEAKRTPSPVLAPTLFLDF
ncbi:hypothetical protein BGZ51_005796 [Haplosporangium sp. Z 767]|nr:hypothetical protein BGZ51_005796 [Haplosporangium sp. Z 767]